MTPLSTVLNHCACCGRELDPRKTLIVVDGVAYCHRCQWEDIEPPHHPCTPPPKGLIAPPPLNTSLVLAHCRTIDTQAAPRLLKELAWLDTQTEREPSVFPHAS